MIGVQLYPLGKDAIDADLPGILSALQAMGYGAVEGLPGHFDDYRALLDEQRMVYAAPHIVPDTLREHDRLMDYLQLMGATDICSSGPLQWDARSIEDFRATCEFLNVSGRLLRDAGIHLHYHNHDFEFEPLIDGTLPVDILLENLDFDVVDFCLDIGWVWYAGKDPCAFMNEHAEKIGYVHLRDFSGKETAPLGDGDMELFPIVSVVNGLPNLRWQVVEHDPGRPDPLADLSRSRSYLDKIH